MKTSLSRTHRTPISPKELVHGFGQKFWKFVYISFYANYGEKNYLVTFSWEHKSFQTMEI